MSKRQLSLPDLTGEDSNSPGLPEFSGLPEGPGLPESLGLPVAPGSSAEDEWLLASVKQLAWATTEDDLLPVCDALRSFLACEDLAVYVFHARTRAASQLRRLIRSTVSGPAAEPDYQGEPPASISVGTRLYEEIATARSTSLRHFHQRHGISDQWTYLPLKQQRKCVGAIVLKRVPGKVGAARFAALKQLGLQLVLAGRRLNRDRELSRYGETLDQLFRYTSEAFCQWDRNRGWQFFNQHLLHRIGYGEDELPLENVFGHPDAMDGEEWRTVSQWLDACLEQGRKIDCEYQVRDPQGGLRTFRTRLRILKKHPTGIVESVAGVSVDVTDSKAVESSARAHAELESWLLATNNHLFNRGDREAIEDTLTALGEKIGLTRCFVRVYRDKQAPVYAEWHRPGMIPIESINPVVPVESPEVGRTFYIEDIDQEQGLDLIRNYARRSRARAQMIIPMSHDQTLHGYLVCQNTDPRNWTALERRAARSLADTLCMVVVKEAIRQKLVASREQFQLAMQAASYGVWEFNVRDQSIYLSRHYYHMLGYEPHEPNGFRPLTVSGVHFDDRKTILDFARSLSEGKITEFSSEARHISGKGEVLWILMRGRVIKWDDTGKPLRAMGTLTDITALKNTQADLQLAYQEAEAAYHAKGEFLARMSHEIRTPMNAIIGMAYLALQSRLSDEQRSYIQDIDQAARGLLQVIDDILDFSKIEAGKLVLENHDFDFYRQMEQIVSRFRPVAERQGLHFSWEIDSAIPRQLRGDSSRLGQVLNNLLSNAFKFTNAGAVSVRIERETAPGDHVGLAFTVTDSGIGLNEGQVERLFDPFTQADSSSTRQYGGTGLGLAISRQLARLMGGDITVSSQPGQGSSFRCSIHCQLAQGPAEETGEAQCPLRNKRVLLVEDNEVGQKVTAAMLRKAGIHATVLENGEEAVRRMKEATADHFDLILMDIEMPRLDGFEAARRIRQMEAHRHIPIVAMTAHLMDEQRDRFTKAGMTDWLSKPVAPDALYRSLEANLAPSEAAVHD